jgi:hypothetical protein
MNISIGDMIASAALLLSIYSTWRSHRFKKKEEVLLELQRKVNELAIEKEKREAIEMCRAELGANLVPNGSRDFRLRIFNKGKAIARNILVDFPDGNDLVPENDVKDKFPMESMEPSQAVDLITAIHMQTKPKHKIHLSWQDANGNLQEKTVTVTIP